jgi:hypothetical protein
MVGTAGLEPALLCDGTAVQRTAKAHYLITVNLRP